MKLNKRQTSSISFVLTGGLVILNIMRAAPSLTSNTQRQLSSAEQAGASQVKAETVRDVTTVLSSKEMEGRGMAQPGGERASKYVAEKFAKAGLKPGGNGSSFLQQIRVRVQTLTPDTQFKVGNNAFKFKQDFAVAQPVGTELKDIAGKIVFVAYGVVSPELQRDDLAGIDVSGKIVMVLSGTPKGVTAKAWEKESAQRTVFGRLINRGAAGFIVIYDGNPSRFPIAAAAVSNRLVSLAEPIASASLPARWSLELLADKFTVPTSVLISESAAENILADVGETFSQIKQQAETGRFVSHDLNVTASISPRVKLETGSTGNVVGIIEGSDPKLKSEALVYSAHYDAFGIDTEGTIYPGASDNALGVGKLVAVAEVFAKLTTRPHRSIIFIATTGEEYGDLGAEYWLQHPTWPIDKVAADINFDGSVLEVWGKLAFLLDFGLDLSDMNDVVSSVASALDIEIYPDPAPDEGFFYRSDQYAFVKKGIPSIFLMGGPAMNPNVLFRRATEWQATRYHMPTDVIGSDWNWEGAQMLAAFALVTGMRVANQEKMPSWKSNSPYQRASKSAKLDWRYRRS